MKYKDIKEELLKISDNNKLLDNVRISKTEKVLDSTKFVNSHISSIDAYIELNKKRKVNKKIVKQYMNRLKNYINELSKKNREKLG